MGINFDVFPGFQQIPFHAYYIVIQCMYQFSIVLCNKFAIKRDVLLFVILWYLKLKYFDNRVAMIPPLGPFLLYKKVTNVMKAKSIY